MEAEDPVEHGFISSVVANEDPAVIVVLPYTTSDREYNVSFSGNCA